MTTPHIILSFEDSSMLDITVNEIVSFKIFSEYYSPVSSATVSFRYPDMMETFTDMKIFLGSTCIFNGVIDSQSTTLDSKGFLTTIKADSLASKMLKNETEPRQYYEPSVDLIYNNHIKKYGFSMNLPILNGYWGTLKIGSSTTDWEVIDAFFYEQDAGVAYVDTNGTLRLRKPSSSSQYLFSNTSTDPLAKRYSSASVKHSTSHLISEINIINNETGRITGTAVDSKVINRGLYRSRYREYDPEDIEAAVSRYSAQLKKQHIKDCVYTFEMPYDPQISLGNGITFWDPCFKNTILLIVTELEWTFDENGYRMKVSAIDRENCY